MKDLDHKNNRGRSSNTLLLGDRVSILNLFQRSGIGK